MRQIVALCVLMVSLAGCREDFDYDKISSGVSLKPSLLVPTAYMDASVRYLFDENADAVEYYTADDGTHRLRLRSVKDSCMVYSLMDILSLHTGQAQTAGQLDLSLLPTKVPASGEPMENSVDVPLMIGQMTEVQLFSVTAGCKVTLEYGGFAVPTEVSVTIGGETMTALVEGSGSKELECDEMTAPVDENGAMMMTLTAKAQSDGVGNFGVLGYGIALTEAKRVVCSTDGYGVSTGLFKVRTNLDDLRNVARKGEFRDPQMSFTCTNGTELNINILPEMKSVGYSLVMLESESMNISAGQVGYEYVVNKRNSNITEFFQNVPDTVTYAADVLLTMPRGKGMITVTPTDSVFLGYRYLVPIEVLFDGEFNCDTVMLGENIEALDEARRLSIVASAANSMPMGVSLYLQIVNTRRGETYSTFAMEDVVPTPPLTDEGLSLDTIKNISAIDLTDENLADLRRADALVVRSHLSTANRYVVPKQEDGLKLDLSFAAQFEFNNY